jgi:hypothetical protein
MKTSKELNIPINRKQYNLCANKPIKIVLPSPFKISDSIIKIECDHTLGCVLGEYKVELSYKEPNPIHISNVFHITSPTYVAFSELTDESDAFLNDEEFYILEITSTVDISIVVVFENKLPAERMHYFRHLFLDHTTA